MEDGGAITVALIALGAVALFATLFWILIAGNSAQKDRDTAHLHEDVMDIEDSLLANQTDAPAAAPPPAPEPVSMPSPPATSDSYVDSVVKRILDATTPDERSNALADIISKALSKEELSSVVAGISPMTGSGDASVKNMTDLERLKELAKILKDGDVPAGLAITGGSSSGLSALYESVVNSLIDSPVISDQTRTLLSYIKMQKCQRDFASDPAKLTACLTAVPATGGTSSAPAAGGTVPSTTPPGATAPLETPPTMVTSMVVLDDGLTAKTSTGSTAKFTFDQNRLTVCADAKCKSTALF
jgi:hypothetical protein